MKPVPVALAIAGLAAVPAAAAVSFTSTFDSVSSATLSNRGWDIFASADGWTGGSGGIEVQSGVAGAALSGYNLVELDTDFNSSMHRVLGAGHYRVDYYYSPRPGQSEATNAIDLSFGDVQLDRVAAAGGGDTEWVHRQLEFTTATSGRLTFAARGTSDSLGGYLDSVTVTSVPEPATWGMMLAGFAFVGAAGRRARHGRPRSVSA